MKHTPAIVVTGLTLAGSLACGGSGVDTFKYTNPPPPKVEYDKRAAPPELVADNTPFEWGEFNDTLNANSAPDGRVYASSDGGCHVYVDDGKERSPGQMPPSREVQCPPEMMAVQWGHCTGDGVVHVNADESACICAQGGNPPPPAFRIPCPKHEPEPPEIEDMPTRNPPAQPPPG